MEYKEYVCRGGFHITYLRLKRAGDISAEIIKYWSTKKQGTVPCYITLEKCCLYVYTRL